MRALTRLVSLTSGAMSDMRLLVWWVKADGSVSSVAASTTVAQQASPPAGATEYDWSGLVTPPSDAAGAVPAIYTTVTNPSTFEIRASRLMMDEATAVEAYVDGDTAGYYWQGDRGASTSGNFLELFTTVRRQQPFRESGNSVKELQIPLVSEYAPVFSTGRKSLTGSPVVCENRGNYVSYPIIEITGVSTNPRVADNTGGDFRTTGLTVASGETVQFDMLNHTGIFTAGARNTQSATRYIDFTNTKWVDLPGASSTTVTYTSGGGTMRVIWRDAWA